MSPRAYCACGKMIETSPDQVGGIVNCPGCGKAVEVPGLKDPLWRVLQGAAVLAVVGVTVLVTAGYGYPTGLLWGGGLALLMWLISRAF